jgi:peptidyl-prolyl cis-trans isomerase C
MKRKLNYFLMFLTVSGLFACSPKKKSSQYYEKPDTKEEKAKLELGKAYKGKNGKLYNPVKLVSTLKNKNLQIAPVAAPGFKEKRKNGFPYQGKKGKFYYFPAKAHKELGIIKSSTVKKAGKRKPVKKHIPPSVEDRKEIVAEINGQKVTVGEVYDMINARPPSWRRTRISEGKKEEFINKFIINDILLYDAAQKSNIFKNDAIVQKAIKKKMIQILRTDKINELKKIIKVTPEIMKKYYNDHKKLFVKPAGLKAAHIVVKTKKEAMDILNELKKIKSKKSRVKNKLWRNLVFKYSIDEFSKKRDGLLVQNRNRVIYKNDSYFDKKLVALVWTLEKGASGDFAGPVKTSAGWHVVMRYHKQKALNISFDDAKKRLSNLVHRNLLETSFKKWIADLKIKYKPQLFLDNIKYVEVKVGKTHGKHRHNHGVKSKKGEVKK